MSTHEWHHRDGSLACHKAYLAYRDSDSFADPRAMAGGEAVRAAFKVGAWWGKHQSPPCPLMSDTGCHRIDALQQLQKATWDGDLVSKDTRDHLVKQGLAIRTEGGWNILTKAGVELLVRLGLLKA